MKLFKNILKSVKPHFLSGGKLEKMYPAYDAFETFLFVPDHTTHSGSHIRDAVDLKRTMAFVVISLIPCIIFGMWNIGDQYFIDISDNNWLNTINIIKSSSKVFLTMAMGAIGLSTNLKDIRNMGYKPFIVGFIGMATVGMASLLTIEIYTRFFI